MSGGGRIDANLVRGIRRGTASSLSTGPVGATHENCGLDTPVVKDKKSKVPPDPLAIY